MIGGTIPSYAANITFSLCAKCGRALPRLHQIEGAFCEPAEGLVIATDAALSNRSFHTQESIPIAYINRKIN